MKYAIMLCLCFIGCKKNPFAKYLSIQEKSSSDQSGVRTPDQIRDLLMNEKYFLTNQVGAGTPITFSTSYGVDNRTGDSNSNAPVEPGYEYRFAAEAGQGYGTVNGNGLFVMQGSAGQVQSSGAEQAILCPGAPQGSQFSGECNWQLSGEDGYTQLMFDVATNNIVSTKGALHTGYNSVQVAKVSFTATLAGQTFDYPDAVRITLTNDATQTDLYFAKNFGPVVMEFRENTEPNGTAKVYMGQKTQSPGLFGF